MLGAQIDEKFRGRSGAADSCIPITVTDSFDGF